MCFQAPLLFLTSDWFSRSIGTDLSVSYNYLSFNGWSDINSTEATGIRVVPGTDNQEVYISGFTYSYPEYHTEEESNFVGFMYKGTLDGQGRYYGKFICPLESDIAGTQLYGPNAPDESDPDYIEVVGCYSMYSRKGVNYAVVYQGSAVYHNGSWTKLTPQPLEFQNVPPGAIAHSTMGGVVVGNYGTYDLNTRFLISNAFVHYINTDTYFTLQYSETTTNITVYGIYWFGGTEYLMAGGMNNSGILVDWDSDTHQASNWRQFRYPGADLTHFEGIHCASNIRGINCSFAVDYVVEDKTYSCFAFAYNITIDGDDSIMWVPYDLPLPDLLYVSSNTVFQNNTIGSYQQTFDPLSAYNYVAQFSSISSDSGGDDTVVLVACLGVLGGVLGLIIFARCYPYCLHYKGKWILYPRQEKGNEANSSA